MTHSPILNDHERQDKYLARLGEDFQFPLFNSVQALHSQRRSGYRDTAAASREIVDNSLEAGASRIHVVFERPAERVKFQRRDAVTSIAFIDDGAGMSPEMARFALSWGGGTHFDPDDHAFIGRFGFGLPNASINQTQRVEVYTRRSADQPFYKGWLDVNEITAGQSTQSVPPPVQADLPDFVQQYLEKMGWDLGSGTVVVWVAPDRISYRTAGTLREHLLHDFGVTYRYLLDDCDLCVAGTEVLKADPLFLMPDARYYRKPQDNGARIIVHEAIPVRYHEDPGTGEKHLAKLESEAELGDVSNVAEGAFQVKVVRFPPGFAVGAGDIPGIDDHARARFEIRKSRRGMSFVRAKREIETVDAFPRSAFDKRSGLGDWPLLQAYAYHWAVEVTFPQTLDEVFGITNDKQSVRPIEDFWRLLANAGIDKALSREQKWQSDQRKRLKEDRETAKPDRENKEDPSPAEFAAQTADAALGERTAVPDHKTDDANRNFEQRAQERARESGAEVDDVREALEQQQRRRKYRIAYIEDEHGPFYTPDWEGLQMVIRINRSHPFFSTLYSKLVGLPGGMPAKEAVDLLLVALARGEMKVDNEETTEFYRVQREHKWSPFLDTAMRTLDRAYPEGDEEEEGETEA